MATQTATTYAKDPRAIHAGVTSISGSYTHSGTLDASAVTIFLCKIPNRATILDLVETHTAGASSCPVDYGIDSTLSLLVSQATLGVVNRLSAAVGVGYQISLSDDAVANYSTLKATATLASATTSFVLKFNLTYSMDR